MTLHKVVIIGGGFGGLYAAKAFRHAHNVEVTLIDRRNFHLFQPLLYQTATGELSPSDIAFPLRVVFSSQKNVTVLLSEVTGIDVAARRVILSEGEPKPYDSLILAAGAENQYFGNDHWSKFAPGLKSLEDATRIRHHILFAFEAAERETDPELRRAWLTFVVVGGGPTGVELAGALGEIANDTLKGDFRHIRPEEARILLLDGAPRLLTAFDESLSRHAEASLIDLGVRTRLNVKVTCVDESGVVIRSPAGEEHISSHTVLWAAGVSASPLGRQLAAQTGAEVDRGGRVIVDQHCNVPGHPELFVIGDLSLFREASGRTVPGVAPPAMQEGRYAAQTILKRLRGKPVSPFVYWDKGSLAVIGRAAAVAQFGKFQFSGLVAWLLWLFVHLMYLVSFQNRLLVFLRWGFNYVTYNRGARLITGVREDGNAPQQKSDAAASASS